MNMQMIVIICVVAFFGIWFLYEALFRKGDYIGELYVYANDSLIKRPKKFRGKIVKQKGMERRVKWSGIPVDLPIPASEHIIPQGNKYVVHIFQLGRDKFFYGTINKDKGLVINDHYDADLWVDLEDERIEAEYQLTGKWWEKPIFQILAFGLILLIAVGLIMSSLNKHTEILAGKYEDGSNKILQAAKAMAGIAEDVNANARAIEGIQSGQNPEEPPPE